MTDKPESEESNQVPEQEHSSADEIFEVIQENAQSEQVPEDTIDSEDVAVEQKNSEESQQPKSGISSDQGDAEETNIEVGEENTHGKISEAIQKITQSPATLPGQFEAADETSTCPVGLLAICAGDIMQNNVTWVSADDSLQQAFAKMQQTDAGYIMVGQNEELEGVVSKSDISKAMSPYLLPIFAKWRRPLDDATLNIRVKWIMSRPVCTVQPQTPLATVMEYMDRFRGRCLPVTDKEGDVLGLVTVFDIFRTLLKTKSDTCSANATDREVVEQTPSTETV